MRLFVGNLPYSTTEGRVRQLFEPFGEVESLTMIRDRETGRFRGFCFVDLENKAARRAIAELNGREVGGRKIRVSEARSRQKKQTRSREPRRNREEIPLHERTGRGNFGGADFPDSGGGVRRRRGEYKRRDDGGSDSEFPHSGGGSRRS